MSTNNNLSNEQRDKIMDESIALEKKQALTYKLSHHDKIYHDRSIKDGKLLYLKPTFKKIILLVRLFKMRVQSLPTTSQLSGDL